ncbi:MAG: accessory factor UbiK family protein [Burkholderiales bacterium]|nr:accessory factor UbiK family protein [Burkholderiales bacterium]
MDKPSFLDDLQTRLAALMHDTPAADLQRNLRAVLEQSLQRLDLATRQDLDTCLQWAASMRERIETLEARIGELEQALAAKPADTAGSPPPPR